MKINSFLSNLFAYLTGKSLFAVSVLIVGILTARWFSTEDRGLYTLFFTSAGLIFSFLHFGLSAGNIYFLNVKKIDMGVLIGNACTYILFVMTLVGLLFSIFAYLEFKGSFLNVSPTMLWALLWLLVFINLTETSFSGLLLGIKDYSFLKKSLIFQAVVILLSGILIVFNLTLQTALVIRVFGFFIFFLWFFILFLKQQKLYKISISLVTLKNQLVFGSKNWFQNCVAFLNARSYIYFLAFFHTSEAVAIFSIAWIFIEIVRFVPDAIGTTLLPELTNMEAGSNKASATARCLRVVLAFVLAISCFMFLSLDFLVPFIFGEAYVSSISAITYLLLGAFFGTIYQVLTRYFTSEAAQRFAIYSSILGLCTCLVGSYFLVPRYSADGAAMAYAGSSFVTGICSLYFFLKVSNETFFSVFRFSISDLKVK